MPCHAKLMSQACTDTDKGVGAHPLHGGGVLLNTPAGLGHLLLPLLSNPFQLCYLLILLLQILHIHTHKHKQDQVN